MAFNFFAVLSVSFLAVDSLEVLLSATSKSNRICFGIADAVTLALRFLCGLSESSVYILLVFNPDRSGVYHSYLKRFLLSYPSLSVNRLPPPCSIL